MRFNSKPAIVLANVEPPIPKLKGQIKPKNKYLRKLKFVKDENIRYFNS